MAKKSFSRIKKPYVLVSLLGGFGNNLFQIALAKKLETSGHNVKFDVSAKKSSTLEVLEFDEIGEYVKKRIAKWTLLTPNLLGRRSNLSRLILEKVFRFDIQINLNSCADIMPIIHRKTALIGYWQSVEGAKFLDQGITKKHGISGKTIGVHVRRGDMKINIEEPLDSFYKVAVSKIVCENPEEKMNLLVFTDDVSYCETYLDLGSEFIISVGNSTLQDFRQMAQCDFLVISRSTYSWWAAFLGSGKVLCPRPWDPKNKLFDLQMIPSNWETVDIANS